ncbi:MAG: TlyA family RNA methyltransferase [Synergistaceae bacterium]|jgi:23S rRNA (cytidine1920-2'-O)/16S rRNA (cytidine1409-2'-O)-methyltransferase|nr:TlyA family RNA methyltransferase [Synergistaceae bacterium]
MRRARLERLDKLLVTRGLAASRSDAADMIARGRVAVGGIRREKPSAAFRPESSIDVAAPGERRYVGRGAHKLLKALDEWEIDPKGLDCADIGASTGGFTQVLLDRGASRVAAVDVGYGQLAWELRNDPRVKVMERTNARYLVPGDIGWLSAIVTVDVSFISLKTVLPAVTELTRDGGAILALVKPQFEVGRERVGKGVVRDPVLHAEVLEGLAKYADTLGMLELKGAAYSPIKGAEGNIEFIFFLSKSGEASAGERVADFETVINEAHRNLG